jgi:hypothetical protein
LLAFSSLAEQAGLQGLATGGLQPAHPARGSNGGHVITLPAPAAEPPRDPRNAFTDLVRDAIARVDAPPAAELVTFTPAAPAPETHKPSSKKLRRPDVGDQAKVAVAGPAVSTDDVDSDGPPYGHAYGHYKDKHGRPEPARKPKPAKKHAPKPSSDGQPVYARTANDEAGKAKAPRPPKMKKVEKAASHGKAKGHSKHAEGHGNGKAKGKSKGKGHSKHGG